MLYLYDEAIAKDLQASFNPDNIDSPVVKVIDAEQAINILAQQQDDEISFPFVVLTRSENVAIDDSRSNFTWQHKGVQSVLDPVTNELYYERSVPVKLSYKLTILATNRADIDELVRELLFKYISMYFITFTLPYEYERKVRFGVAVDTSEDIEHSSGTPQYLASGKLYQAIISLRCEGCVLVTYTAAKLKRISESAEICIEP